VDINDETELEEYSVEIDILSQCRHKNIVGIYEAYYFNSKLCVSISFMQLAHSSICVDGGVVATFLSAT